MEKIFFRGISDGKKHEIEKNDYWLRICPKCKTKLHGNKYKDLYVNRLTNYSQDISISIGMEYCSNCCELYIRNDY
jgi:ribosomal protein L34E